MCLNEVTGMGGRARKCICGCDQALTTLTSEPDDKVVLIQFSITLFRTHRPVNTPVVNSNFVYQNKNNRIRLLAMMRLRIVIHGFEARFRAAIRKQITCHRPGRATIISV